MLDSLAYRSGINVEKLLAARHLLQHSLPGVTLYGTLARAGLPHGYTAPYPYPEEVAA